MLVPGCFIIVYYTFLLKRDRRLSVGSAQFSLAEVGYPWLGLVASCMYVVLICRVHVLSIWFRLLQGLGAALQLELDRLFLLRRCCYDYVDCIGVVLICC